MSLLDQVYHMEIENNRMLPFLGTRLLNKSTHVETKVYVKPTNSGLMAIYMEMHARLSIK